MSVQINPAAKDNNVSFIIFDLGGVLVNDFVAPLQEHLSRQFQLSQERSAVLRTLCKQLWCQMKKSPEPTQRFFFRQLLNHFPEFSPLTEDDLFGLMSNQLSHRVFPETVSFVEKLARSGSWQLGVLSNHSHDWYGAGSRWFEALLEAFGLHRVFTDDRIVVSSHVVKASKPNRAIYQVLLDRIQAITPGTHPSQVLFVDDKQENVEAARALGLRAFCFDGRREPHCRLAERFREHGIIVDCEELNQMQPAPTRAEELQQEIRQAAKDAIDAELSLMPVDLA
jgi:FMN phosphatase YigB (HAD superfamily)